MAYDPTAEVAMEADDSLSDAECRRLLATRAVGRVGVTSGGLPCILPVYYEYEDDAIVFRTDAGTKLQAAMNGDVLAFEIDDYDPGSGIGWSVLVQGRASVRAADANGDGDRSHRVSLGCDLMRGQRLATGSRG